METSADNSARHRPARPARWYLRVGGPGLVAVIVLMLLSSAPKTRPVSQVIRDIHQIALAKPDGGLIGPFWISAAEIDPLDGKLKSFNVEFGNVYIASKSAKVIVDPRTDSIVIEMWEVVVTRVPELGEKDPDEGLVDLPRYMLGPIPYGVDIVPDDQSLR